MQTFIEINNLTIEACHGVYDFEKSTAQPFIFSCKINFDFIEAAKNDNIKNSISYCDIMQDINDFCKNNFFDLIETLAYRTALLLINKYPIKSISLNVKKPEAKYNLSFEDVGVTVHLEWHTSYLSLGSNLGNKQEYLINAINALNSYDEIKVIKQSSILLNEPYGGVATEQFANMAIKIETLFEPLQLLNVIHLIEANLGRERTIHWGNRTIDIDIITFDNLCLNTEELIIPHKDYLNRDFVLIPLHEIAPSLFSLRNSNSGIKIKKL